MGVIKKGVSLSRTVAYKAIASALGEYAHWSERLDIPKDAEHPGCNDHADAFRHSYTSAILTLQLYNTFSKLQVPVEAAINMAEAITDQAGYYSIF